MRKFVGLLCATAFLLGPSACTYVSRQSLGTGGVQGDSDSEAPSLSETGRYLVFASYASNLVPNDTHGKDIFRRDTVTGTTTLISVASDGSQANGASDNP